jgi:hypothetical protein
MEVDVRLAPTPSQWLRHCVNILYLELRCDVRGFHVVEYIVGSYHAK